MVGLRGEVEVQGQIIAVGDELVEVVGGAQKFGLEFGENLLLDGADVSVDRCGFLSNRCNG